MCKKENECRRQHWVRRISDTTLMRVGTVTATLGCRCKREQIHGLISTRWPLNLLTWATVCSRRSASVHQSEKMTASSIIHKIVAYKPTNIVQFTATGCPLWGWNTIYMNLVFNQIILNNHSDLQIKNLWTFWGVSILYRIIDHMFLHTPCFSFESFPLFCHRTLQKD